MLQALAIVGLFFLLFAIIGICLYVIFSFSLYKMALKQDLENAWIAWIPIAQCYILGKLIKTLKIFNYEIPQIEIVLPTAAVIVLLFNHIRALGSLLSLANYILMLFALNKIYKIYKPESAVLYTVLSIFGIPVPFIFLSLKNLEQASDVN